MNWEAAGVVAEIIGAVSVVVTLIYLAKQIRLAREDAQVQGTYSSVNIYANWRSHLIDNPDLTDLIAKANEQQDITSGEKIRLAAVLDDFVITSFVSFVTSQKANPLYGSTVEADYFVEFLKANPGLLPYWEGYESRVNKWSPELAAQIRERLKKPAG